MVKFMINEEITKSPSEIETAIIQLKIQQINTNKKLIMT